MLFWTALCVCVTKKPHQSILTRKEVRKAMHICPLSNGIYKYLILSLLELFLKHNSEKQKSHSQNLGHECTSCCRSPAAENGDSVICRYKTVTHKPMTLEHLLIDNFNPPEFSVKWILQALSH